MNNKLLSLLFLIPLLSLSTCANQKLTSGNTKDQQNLNTLFELMSGEFSSEEQAAKDSLFYDINLVMYPIWNNNGNTKWLYVEQAVTKFIDKPYRQRVYKLSSKPGGIIESSVFELSTPERFIHGWQSPKIFDQITPDSLIVRQGCAVYLKKNDDCFIGSTKDKDCKSTLRGAAYATSQVNICKDQVVSWDQGWNDKDNQVWGAETEGYVFKKKE